VSSLEETLILPGIAGVLGGLAGGLISGWLGLKSVAKAQRLAEIDRLVSGVRTTERLCLSYWEMQGSAPEIEKLESKIISEIRFLSRDCRILPHKKKAIKNLMPKMKRFRQSATGGDFQVKSRPANKKQANDVHVCASILMMALRDLER